MARKRRKVIRELFPDPKYNDLKVTKFINCIMVDGKKSVAEGIVYGAFDVIKEKTNKDPLEIFLKAISNAKPLLKVVSKRVGGQNYQVPLPVNERIGQAIAFRWIIDYSRKRSEKTMVERLAAELLACERNEGSTIKKKEDTHKMAESNKAFAHIRW